MQKHIKLYEDFLNEGTNVSDLRTGQRVELSNGKEYIIDFGGNETQIKPGSYIYIGNVENYKDCYVATAFKIANAVTKIVGEDKPLLDRFVARWDAESTTMKPWSKMKL
jgi:hypothetical protein